MKMIISLKRGILILKGESERADWDGDISPDVWYKDIPQVSSLVLSNSGIISIEANEVCLLLAASNGESLTSRCTPFSPFK